MRRAWLLVLVACSSEREPCVPGEMGQCVEWRWTFFDRTTNERVACPDAITSIDIVVMDTWASTEISSVVAGATFDCSDGRGTIRVEQPIVYSELRLFSQAASWATIAEPTSLSGDQRGTIDMVSYEPQFVVP